ncbi:MAG: hypothetical protein R6V01_04460 [Thermoplasmatota archaeon]
MRFGSFGWGDWLLFFSTLVIVPVLMYICSRKDRFGWTDVMLFDLFAGVYFPIFILNALEGLNELVRENGDPAVFGTSELIMLTGLAFIPTILSVSLIMFFAERDPVFKDGKLFLPISFWEEKMKDEERMIYPQDIRGIYPRWMAFPEKSKWPKQPEYHAKGIFGYGIRIKDGRRFGYSLFSRAVLKKDLLEFLGEKEFKRIRKDHAVLTDEEWRYLKRRGSHWYTNLDSPLLHFILFNVAVLFITMGIVTMMQDSILMPPLLIFILAGTFFPSMILFLRGMEDHNFYKGTIFRMKDREEKLPDWLIIRSNQLSTDKDNR